MSWELERRNQRRQPERVGDVIDTVLAKIGGGRRPPIMSIRDAWDDVAGARWRSVSRPVKVAAATVVVEVKDGATASMMRFDLADLERRLATIVPGAGVSKVVLRVASRPWSKPVR